MTSIKVDISSLFSQLNQYTWIFHIADDSTRISCVSNSEEDARNSILNFITENGAKTKNYRDATKLKNLEQRIIEFKLLPPRETLDVNLNIGCYTTDIFDYHLDVNLNIRCYTTDIFDYHIDLKINGTDQALEKIVIIRIRQHITPFRMITIFSYLDG